MTGCSCRHELDGICQKLDGAFCRPGMKGCVLSGKVTFQDGVQPGPRWPADHPRSRRPVEEPPRD
jgi:hypothetical protein